MEQLFVQENNFVKEFKIKSLIFSVVYAVLIISICVFYFKDFFNIDDACNEFLGFFKQYGKIWLSGHIPFITPDLWIGGNAMVELQRGIFLPQNILASILTYQFEYVRLTGVFLALINISLLTFSGISIAQSFNISKSYAYGLGAFLAINPMFLLQYSGPWWNHAWGHAWAMASIATFLLLLKKSSVRNILLNFISVLSLLCAGCIHETIGYGIFCLIALSFCFKENKKYKLLLITSLPSFLALICAIPVYSEYLYLHHIITRPFGLNNCDRFLSQPWASVFMSFFPSYYDFMNYLGKYQILYVQLGFSTLFLPLSIFYTKLNSLQEIDKKKIYFIIALCIAYFFLLQTPSQVGSFRWPFRFWPFLSFSTVLLSFYLLDKAKIVVNKKRSRAYLFFILASFFMAAFSCPGKSPFQLYSLGLLLLCPVILRIKNNKTKTLFLISSATLSLIITLSGLPSLATRNYLQYPRLENKIAIDKNLNLDGNIISLTQKGGGTRHTLNTLNSSQFGYYNIRSINGYSPNGHTGLEKLLPYTGVLALFRPIETLHTLLSPSGYGKSCVAELMRVSTIVMPDRHFKRVKERLQTCGFTVITAASHGDLYVSRNRSDTIAWTNNFPFTYPYLSTLTVIEQNNNGLTLKIPPHTGNLTIIFPRVWWPGYRATLNNHPLPVSAYKKAILQVKLNKNEYGILTIHYFPITWRVTKFFTCTALLGLLLLLGYTFRISRIQPQEQLAHACKSIE